MSIILKSEMENDPAYPAAVPFAAPFACTFCSKTYVHYTSLSRHKRDYHPSSRKVRQCPKPTAVNIRTILKHACLPFPCSSCPKAFIHQTSLSRHRRDYHPDERYTKRNGAVKRHCSPARLVDQLKECCIVLNQLSYDEQEKVEGDTSFSLIDHNGNERILDGDISSSSSSSSSSSDSSSSSSQDNLREDLLRLASAKENQKEGIVMWMYKEEDPLNRDGYWNLVWSPDDLYDEDSILQNQ